MIKLCDKNYEELLKKYLEEEAAINTFILADIMNYGFHNDFQKVYIDEEPETGSIQGVYLSFYNVFLAYSKDRRINQNFALKILEEQRPDVIMGKNEVIEQIYNLAKNCDLEYRHNKKSFYELKEKNDLIKLPGSATQFAVKLGQVGDEDKIFDFLMTIDEIKDLYSSKDMIRQRLTTGDGKHYFIEEKGEIICHGNSAARSELTVMLGGLGTKPAKRRKSLAKAIVYRLAEEVLLEGKKPCLICERGEADNIFVDMGFTKVGYLSVMEKKKSELK